VEFIRNQSLFSGAHGSSVVTKIISRGSSRMAIRLARRKIWRGGP